MNDEMRLKNRGHREVEVKPTLFKNLLISIYLWLVSFQVLSKE